jgi:hypothetical protein
MLNKRIIVTLNIARIDLGQRASARPPLWRTLWENLVQDGR